MGRERPAPNEAIADHVVTASHHYVVVGGGIAVLLGAVDTNILYHVVVAADLETFSGHIDDQCIAHVTAVGKRGTHRAQCDAKPGVAGIRISHRGNVDVFDRQILGEVAVGIASGNAVGKVTDIEIPDREILPALYHEREAAGTIALVKQGHLRRIENRKRMGIGHVDWHIGQHTRLIAGFRFVADQRNAILCDGHLIGVGAWRNINDRPCRRGTRGADGVLDGFPGRCTRTRIRIVATRRDVEGWDRLKSGYHDAIVRRGRSCCIGNQRKEMQTSNCDAEGKKLAATNTHGQGDPWLGSKRRNRRPPLAAIVCTRRSIRTTH